MHARNKIVHARDKIVHASDLVHTSFKLEMICTVATYILYIANNKIVKATNNLAHHLLEANDIVQV